MKLTGLHLLLTFQCLYECDHCFAWGSPKQSGTMTLRSIRDILDQAEDLATIEWIYFEGGEPFLFYPILEQGIREAAERGFRVGLVSNAYWATDETDVETWLKPFAGTVEDLSISSDLYHADEKMSRQAQLVKAVAKRLGIPCSVLSIAQPGGCAGDDEFNVCFRGRAVEALAPQAEKHPWTRYTECTHENLSDPGRIHVDPLGNLHVCQGLSIGNLFSAPLQEIWSGFEPVRHPVIGPLLEGGPAELARVYGIEPEAAYADECHLCYLTRKQLRGRFPHILTPDQMYGEFETENGSLPTR